jgi:Arc/MetJ-type ribon-helix-helix transcriptional regulator
MFEEPNMEKLTINLPPVEIARIDILVEAGYYPSRAEFIRAAIRKTLDGHQEFIAKKVEGLTLDEKSAGQQKVDFVAAVGVQILSKDDFERAIVQGRKLSIKVVGMLVLKKDVKPEHVESAVETVKIYGILRASPQVKKALLKKAKVED